MLTLIIRSVIIYFLVLIVFRLMGKRQLGQMQPFELVLTLILADIATIPMTEMSVPLLHGIVPLLTLLIIHYLLTLFSMFFPKFSSFLSGKPVIVIDQNGLNYKNIKSLNMTIDDIFEALRSAGCFNIEDVLYAIMETNGKISVMTKAETPEQNIFPLVIISEGKIKEDNVSHLKTSKQTILDFIKSKNYSLKKIIILTLDKNGKMYIQYSNKNPKTFQTNIKEKV